MKDRLRERDAILAPERIEILEFSSELYLFLVLFILYAFYERRLQYSSDIAMSMRFAYFDPMKKLD